MEAGPGPVGRRSLRRAVLAAVVLWLAFVGAEATARVAELYRTHPPVDLLNHFLSGAALAATWIAWVRWRGGRARAVAVLGAAAVSLVWEVGEIVEERIRVNPPHLRDPFLWDGVGDVAAAVLAAAAVAWILVRPRDSVEAAGPGRGG